MRLSLKSRCHPKSLLLIVFLGATGLFSADPTSTNTAFAQEDVPEGWTPRYVELGNVQLQIGDADGERVKELQASLNRELRGLTIRLEEEVLIGGARGPAEAEDRDKVRRAVLKLAYQKKIIFLQMRGHWVPLDAARSPIDDPELTVARYLLLPEEPMRVDGVFGQHTFAGVILFQMVRGLPITGEVDVVTLDKLEPMIPTNVFLATIMEPVGRILKTDRMHSLFIDEDDTYPIWVKRCTAFVMTLFILRRDAVAENRASPGPIHKIPFLVAVHTHLLSIFYCPYEEQRISANDPFCTRTLHIYRGNGDLSRPQSR